QDQRRLLHQGTAHGDGVGLRRPHQRAAHHQEGPAADAGPSARLRGVLRPRSSRRLPALGRGFEGGPLAPGLHRRGPRPRLQDRRPQVAEGGVAGRRAARARGTGDGGDHRAAQGRRGALFHPAAARRRRGAETAASAAGWLVTSAVSDWEIGRREGELPEGWAEATLEEIVIHFLGGDWGEAPDAVERDPELVLVRVLRGTEFRDWHRAKGATAALRAIKRSSLAKRQLAAGDLVVEISGGGAGQPVGRTLVIDEEALLRADAPLICNNFCRQMRLHPDVDPFYVHLALQYLYLSGGFDEYQTQTTNIRNLNFSSFLSGVIIPLPPRAEQERIVETSRELLARVQRVQESLGRVPE